MILVLGGRGFLYSSVWRGKRPPVCFCSRAKERTRGISGSRWRWWVDLVDDVVDEVTQVRRGKKPSRHSR
jgi:hypothetical protein